MPAQITGKACPVLIVKSEFQGHNGEKYLPEGCPRPKVKAAQRMQEALKGGHFPQNPETTM